MHAKDVPQVEESAVTRPLLADEGPCCQYGTDVSSSEGVRQPEVGGRLTCSSCTWARSYVSLFHNSSVFLWTEFLRDIERLFFSPFRIRSLQKKDKAQIIANCATSVHDKDCAGT